MWIGDARPFSTASSSERSFRERPVAGVTLATARGTDHVIQILVCRSSKCRIELAAEGTRRSHRRPTYPHSAHELAAEGTRRSHRQPFAYKHEGWR
jgi:hypothetical protein